MQSPNDDARHFIETQMGSPQSLDRSNNNFYQNDASIEFVNKHDLHNQKNHYITEKTLSVNIAKLSTHFNGLPMDASIPPPDLIGKSFDGGIAKTKLTIFQTVLLGFLAGIFVAMGGHASVRIAYSLDIKIYDGAGNYLETEKASPSFQAMVIGAIFPVGLMMIVVNGAELFTGNTMAVMPGFLHGKITVRQILRNWGIVYTCNFCGSLLYTTMLVKIPKLLSGSYEDAISGIAEGKVAASFGINFCKAVGCNWMVNMAILMGTSAKTTGGRLFGLWWPIAAFVVMGFEHSVANMFFIPAGMMHGADVSVGQFLAKNLIPVTLGNIVGGAILVGINYTMIYKRPEKITIRF